MGANMTVELTTEIDPAWVPTLLQLEYEASRPLYDFVFDNESEARTAQRALFDSGAGEWVSPHGKAALQDGEFVGLIAGALAADLTRARLGAALALTRAGVFDDADVARRMQLGVGALVQPEEGDYYYGVVGVTPAARGTGVGVEIFELARKQGRESGATRALGQTLAGSRLVSYYTETGHHWVGEGKASDPKTGRELHYRHFAHML